MCPFFISDGIFRYGNGLSNMSAEQLFMLLIPNIGTAFYCFTCVQTAFQTPCRPNALLYYCSSCHLCPSCANSSRAASGPHECAP
ncbi:hypothetical protein EZZ75_04465 [Neisseria meningitidis]|nr:hypothetical protein [Neisseria meningitidis]MBW8006708.1 hypothetical protein [Neisseria meningitidis]TKV54476.1 hypothetical protein EHH59_07900 [Neisseria meningitidis]